MRRRIFSRYVHRVCTHACFLFCLGGWSEFAAGHAAISTRGPVQFVTLITRHAKYLAEKFICLSPWLASTDSDAVCEGFACCPKSDSPQRSPHRKGETDKMTKELSQTGFSFRSRGGLGSLSFEDLMLSSIFCFVTFWHAWKSGAATMAGPIAGSERFLRTRAKQERGLRVYVTRRMQYLSVNHVRKARVPRNIHFPSSGTT